MPEDESLLVPAARICWSSLLLASLKPCDMGHDSSSVLIPTVFGTAGAPCSQLQWAAAGSQGADPPQLKHQRSHLAWCTTAKSTVLLEACTSPLLKQQQPHYQDLSLPTLKTGS